MLFLLLAIVWLAVCLIAVGVCVVAAEGETVVTAPARRGCEHRQRQRPAARRRVHAE